MLLGMLERVAHFAVDLSDCDAAVNWAERQDPPWRFEDCRAAGTALAAAETGILAQARSQLDWHSRHGFCSVCGHPTDSKRGGQVRECPSCSAQHFPRTDPVVITVVGDADTDRCLLGQSRGRLSRLRMYSALAGFVDQGGGDRRGSGTGGDGGGRDPREERPLPLLAAVGRSRAR